MPEKFSASRYASRRQNLLKLLKQNELQGLLVFAPVNVRYLTGFSGDSSVLVIGPEICVLVTDGRFTAQLAEECPDLELDVRKVSETQPERIGKLLVKRKLARVGFESDRVTVDSFGAIEKALSKLELVPAKGLVEQLRVIKDADEIADIRTAIRFAERSFQMIRHSLQKNMTELDVRDELEAAMRKLGGAGPGFETIVGSGPNSALPHAHPGDRQLLHDQHVLIDWGVATHLGYRSDLTRVLFTSKISPKLQNIYSIVRDAHQQAIAAIRPGITCAEVDAVARRIITEKGFGAKFNHSLGHSFGLEIHEGVRLSPNSQQVLQPGMVVTVEPGIYLQGFGGVRIEDDVLVTRDGYEVLSSLSSQLEEMYVDC
jgi:Xaa-Pro aminopeptidase